jgi:hypothetical protein
MAASDPIPAVFRWVRERPLAAEAAVSRRDTGMRSKSGREILQFSLTDQRHHSADDQAEARGCVADLESAGVAIP